MLVVTADADRKLTSRYVLYEISRGYLQYLIRAYNKSLQCESFADLLDYTRKLFASHWRGSIEESMANFIRRGSLVDPESSTPQDEQMLDYYRSFLRRVIRQGWKKLEEQVGEIVNDVGCRSDVQAPIHDDGGYQQELKSNLCGKYSNCGLKPYVEKRVVSFSKVREVIERMNETDGETRRRIEGIRGLCKNPRGDFDAGHCYSTSDAIILHEVPGDTAAVTSNARHFVPIASIIGVPLRTY